MTRSTPLVFFGSDHFSLPILTALIEANYSIKLVVTKSPSVTSRRQVDRAPVSSYAQKQHLPTLAPDRLDEAVAGQLSASGANFAVLASYGKILPEAVLKSFTAIVNVHPSLLPRWRGPSPVEAAILAGDTQTGVTLMKLEAKMDAGPIYFQEPFDLTGQETQSALRTQLAKLGADLLIKRLPAIIDGSRSAVGQEQAAATYCPLLNKTDGELDWRQPAQQLERQIRAYREWPKAHTTLFRVEVAVLAAEVSPERGSPGQTFVADQQLGVYAGRGGLIIQQLQPAGRKPLSGAEFLRGYAR